MFTFKIYSTMDFDPHAGVRMAKAAQEVLSAFLGYPNEEQKKILERATLSLHITGHDRDAISYATEILLRLESPVIGTRNLKVYHQSSITNYVSCPTFLSNKNNGRRVPPDELFQGFFPQPVKM